ncbi:MAG TPA: hypothetical protein VK785_04730 [Opitutaceae bacterium]|jgi:hypothetical protein|nr:hypothetical protein [Opitutaceae bacterium]
MRAFLICFLIVACSSCSTNAFTHATYRYNASSGYPIERIEGKIEDDEIVRLPVFAHTAHGEVTYDVIGIDITEPPKLRGQKAVFMFPREDKMEERTYRFLEANTGKYVTIITPGGRWEFWNDEVEVSARRPLEFQILPIQIPGQPPISGTPPLKD